MPSSRLKKLATAAAAALVIVGSVSEAFAIRNRYTNQQNEGFAALLFGDYGEFEDAPYEPAYRPYRYGRPIRSDHRRHHADEEWY